MEPINFKQAKKNLQPSEAKYSKNVTGVQILPVWSDGEQCVSCWKMSIGERISALLFGRVWLAVLSGYSQHPVAIVVSKEYLQEKEQDNE